MQNKNYSWTIFWGVSLMGALCFMDAVMMNLAVAPIARYFITTMTKMQWMVNIYSLVGLALIVFFGRIADLWNRKIIFLSGVVLIVTGSLIGAFAANAWMLMAGRAVQGIGLGAGVALGLIILTTAFPVEKRAFVVALYGSVLGLSQVIGPALGGFLIRYISWRALFLLNVPIGIVAFLCLLRVKEVKKDSFTFKAIDWSGFILFATALVVITVAINQLGRWGAGSADFITVLSIGILALILFVIKSVLSKKQLLPMNIFKVGQYNFICIVRLLTAIIWMVIIFVVPIYLQNIVGYSASVTGLVLMASTFGFVIVYPFVGKWTDRVGPKKPILVSNLCFVVSLILLAMHGPLYLYIIALLIVSLQPAFFVPGAVTTTIKSLPPENVGVGMAFYYTLLMLGLTLGVAIAGSLISLISRAYLIKQLAIRHLHFGFIKFNFLRRASEGARSFVQFSKHFNHAQSVKLFPITSHAFVNGSLVVIYVTLALSIIALLLGLFVKSA